VIRYPEKLRSSANYAKKSGDPRAELVTLAVPGLTLQTRVRPSIRAQIYDLIKQIQDEEGEHAN
jgi:hypothetical protein